MTSLFEETYNKYKYVLVIPNITYLKDLTKDSYIQVLSNMIDELNKIRDDLFFYLLLPEYVRCLDRHNTQFLKWTVHTYAPTMRSHFDVYEFKKLVYNKEIDLVFSHLPEHTHQVKNVLYNITHNTPPIFGYCHWFDFKNNTPFEVDSFKQNICGILEMERCYVNTKSQKSLVLKQAKEIFNKKTIKDLDRIITVHHLGVKESDIVSKINHDYEKVIVFNHRPATYKHYDHFLSVMDKLWEQRQDFTVWVPLADTPDREYVDISKYDKKGYYNQLNACCVGYSPKQLYGGWSVATTDGMMNGLPYIRYKADYYKELYSSYKNTHTTDNELIELFNLFLDNKKYRNRWANHALKYTRSRLCYSSEINRMSDYMNVLLDSIKGIDSEKSHEILEFIKSNKRVSRDDILKFLGWGRGIKFTPYRKFLLSQPQIKMAEGSTPVYYWDANY